MMNDPAHTEYLAEQITKVVLYGVGALVALYFVFRTKKTAEIAFSNTELRHYLRTLR